MNEHSNIVEARLKRLIELRWLREVVARKLAEGGTAADHARLEEIFAQVNADLDALERTFQDYERD